ncbi:MAG: aminotransferase class I/II-fold pyridoxal phosphate-dependent enzyme [Pirellulales bacterium]|nr:aminotransferase class I/II-fold pyridoxal phosphate-dependent enzyme [Pirellulales bacterium]
MSHPWIAQRTAHMDSSGIRKAFDLAAKMSDPVNLSIGQPDFDVPDPIQEAAIDAIKSGKNCYSPTQGIEPLLARLQTDVDSFYGHSDRRVLVTSGTSGALVLAALAMVDPGDQIILFDPYFVMYPSLLGMMGGICIPIDTYPDFRIDVSKVEAAITPKTKMILLNSPANPTGAIADEDAVRGVAELAARHHIALISDEIYSQFSYDRPAIRAAKYNEEAIVIDGFSKTYGMTGWRIGWIHGPSAIIERLTMLQQYTFVCAPHPLQWAALTALDIDTTEYMTAYRKRRDLLMEELNGFYECTEPGGAFYAFPKAPWGTGTQFVEAALAHDLLIIPGNIFSRRNTHFRISFAVAPETIQRGGEILRRLADQRR